MAKMPEDRYQSAAGLKADLQKCLNAEPGQPFPDFVLGENDVSPRFALPEKLYGREQEIARLQTAFAQNDNQPRLVLIRGYSGVGKSRLVAELQGAIADRRGFFLTGKFDQMNRDAPFQTLRNSFRELMRQIMAESEEAVAQWRERLRDALGTNGQIVAEALPELTQILGPQLPVPLLPPVESQNRFERVFRAFLQVFCRPEHPLCLFLDDLQWIDAATLAWLETTVGDVALGSLLLIGAYRENEVSASHLLQIALDRIRERNLPLETLLLQLPPFTAVSRFVADAVHVDEAGARELAQVLYDKTQGNPFFLNQLLLSLHEEDLLRFDYVHLRWTWDIEAIAAREVSVNVVELLVDRMARLSAECREMLPLAACIGAEFTLGLLQSVSGWEAQELETRLYEAATLGLIAPTNSERAFRFRHDRVQQSALLLLSEATADRVHLLIGRKMVAEGADAPADPRLFAALGHLLAAEDQITDHAEREQIARLSVTAAGRARRATAYARALDYCRAGMRLMAGLETAQSPLWLECLLESAQAAYLSGDDAQAEQFFARALEAGTDDFDRARVYEQKTHFLTQKADFPGAYACGREGAALFGVCLPAGFHPAYLARQLALVKAGMRGRSPRELAGLPEMTDPRLRIGARLATAVLKAAYQIRPELCVAGSATLVNLCLRRGNFPECPVAYLPLGPIFLGGVLGRHKAGHEWGQLCLALLDKFHVTQQTAEVNFVYAYFAHAWLRPLETTEAYFRVAYQSGAQMGDFFHAGCGCSGLAQHALMQGADLNSVLAECERGMDFLERVQNRENLGTLLAVRQAVRCLRGETHAPDSFADATFDEAAYVEELKGYGSPHFAHYYHVNKLQTLVLWREHDAALNVARASSAYLKSSIGMQHAVEHHFYAGLLYAELIALRRPGPRRRWLQTLRATIRRFRQWARNCPENFLHRALLLEAELAQVTGQDTIAGTRYDQAIEAAAQRGFAHHEALANALCGRWHRARGRMRNARFYLREAAYGYRRWGATAIADALIEEIGEWVSREQSSAEAAESTRAASGSTRHDALNLDMDTVVKAAQAIASEVKLSELLARLLHLVMENAGATRGILLLPRGGDYVAQAEGNGADIQVKSGLPLAEHPALARSVVNYVARSRETTIVNRMGQDARFAADAYLQAARPRSVLCAPLLNRGVLSGILYLENGLIEDAFTASRIQLLQLLSAQFAISIENALAYEVLEQKVQERTAQLEARNALIQQIFGRYNTPEVVERLLEDPGGLKMGGEKREVTALIADLRGFAACAESLAPDQVVTLINNFLRVMTEIIIARGGTVNGLTGDGMLVIFGAPLSCPDHANRAVRCGLAMQLAMAQVNEFNAANGLSQVQMGIGISTGEVVAGNIGSLQRASYTVMGTAVNLASRIESVTTGGQIFISEATLTQAGPDVEIGARLEIEAKGFRGKIAIYDTRGVAGRDSLRLPEETSELIQLPHPIAIRYTPLKDKSMSGESQAGRITWLSEVEAHISAPNPPPPLTDVAVRLAREDGSAIDALAYAKVTADAAREGADFVCRFTSVETEARDFLNLAVMPCALVKNIEVIKEELTTQK